MTWKYAGGAVIESRHGAGCLDNYFEVFLIPKKMWNFEEYI
jgi:hypothetical protein